MWPNPQFPADLVKFTEEIFNRNFHFLCSVIIPPLIMIGALSSSISYDKSIKLISSQTPTKILWFATAIYNHNQACLIYQHLPPPMVSQHPSSTSSNLFTTIKHYSTTSHNWSSYILIWHPISRGGLQDSF